MWIIAILLLPFVLALVGVYLVVKATELIFRIVFAALRLLR